MHRHFQDFARYNEWANERLYEAASRLSDADYRADRGAFFRSMHGTLNHLLVTDRIWLRRFTGETGPALALDQILHDGFAELRDARRAEDQRIRAYVDGLDESTLAGTLRYRSISNPAEIAQPLAEALAHLFNHQTHHRGQAHCLLTQMTGDAPSFDLIAFQRSRG